MKKLLLLMMVLLGSLTAKADIYKDKLMQLQNAGDTVIVIDVSDLSMELLNRNMQVMTEDGITYIASVFRKFMTEEEFLRYTSCAYDEANKELIELQNKIFNGIDFQFSIPEDSLAALVESGRDIERVVAKDCSEEYAEAFDRFCYESDINTMMTLNDNLQAGAMQMSTSSGQEEKESEYERYNTVLGIYLMNVKNELLNYCIDNVSKEELDAYHERLMATPGLRENNLKLSQIYEYMTQNYNRFVEAVMGYDIQTMQDEVESRVDEIKKKYGIEEIQFEFRVFFKLERKSKTSN